MKVCSDCGVIFTRLAKDACGKCVRRDAAPDTNRAAREIVEELPQCSSCGMVYKYLRTAVCGACQSLAHDEPEPTDAAVASGSKSSCEIVDAPASGSKLQPISLELSDMETSDDEPEPSISDTGKGKGKAVDRVPDDAYMAPSAKEDKRSAVSIMFLCELNLQREDGQTVGTRVPMETRAFDFDEPIDNVLNAFVEAFNEESTQWTNLYSGRKLERGDKVLFVFKNGAKIPSSFYCSSVGTFWNTFSEVSDRYFPEKDIQSRTVHIVMLVSDELVTERTPKNALAPKKPEKRKVLETCQRPPPAKREKVAEHHVAVKTEPVEAAVPPQKPAPVPHATASQLQLPTEGNQRARSQSNAAVSERPLDTAKKPAAQGNAIVKQEDVADGTIPTIKIVEPAFAPKNGTTENSGTTIATGPPDGTGKGKAPAQIFEGAERRTSPRPGPSPVVPKPIVAESSGSQTVQQAQQTAQPSSIGRTLANLPSRPRSRPLPDPPRQRSPVTDTGRGRGRARPTERGRWTRADRAFTRDHFVAATSRGQSPMHSRSRSPRRSPALSRRRSSSWSRSRSRSPGRFRPSDRWNRPRYRSRSRSSSRRGRTPERFRPADRWTRRENGSPRPRSRSRSSSRRAASPVPSARHTPPRSRPRQPEATKLQPEERPGSSSDNFFKNTVKPVSDDSRSAPKVTAPRRTLESRITSDTLSERESETAPLTQEIRKEPSVGPLSQGVMDGPPPRLLTRMSDDTGAAQPLFQPRMSANGTQYPPHVEHAQSRPTLAMAIASIHSPSTPWLKTAHLRGFVHVPAFEPRYARGTLYLEVHGALRVTARRQQLPGEHPMDLLRWILSRGIIVAWRVPRPMELGAPAAEHLDSLTTRWFHGDYNSPKDYQDVIKSLLCRPPARQWLLRGGLAWRLALHYGPPWLMGVALQGPSSIALTLGRGSYHQLPVLSIGDAMTAQENEMLVGRTPGGSVWPSIALWESSGMWIGEWTETAEFWFMRRVSELAEGRNVYQTEAQWARELRKALTPKERKLGEEDGSLRRAMELAHIYPEVAASSMIQVG